MTNFEHHTQSIKDKIAAEQERLKKLESHSKVVTQEIDKVNLRLEEVAAINEQTHDVDSLESLEEIVEATTQELYTLRTQSHDNKLHIENAKLRIDLYNEILSAWETVKQDSATVEARLADLKTLDAERTTLAEERRQLESDRQALTTAKPTPPAPAPTPVMPPPPTTAMAEDRSEIFLYGLIGAALLGVIMIAMSAATEEAILLSIGANMIGAGVLLAVGYFVMKQ